MSIDLTKNRRLTRCLLGLLEEPREKLELVKLYYGNSINTKTAKSRWKNVEKIYKKLLGDFIDEREAVTFIKGRRPFVIDILWEKFLQEWEQKMKNRGIHLPNSQIDDLREFIKKHRKVLFDFEIFESLFYDESWSLPSIWGIINIALFYFFWCINKTQKFNEVETKENTTIIKNIRSFLDYYYSGHPFKDLSLEELKKREEKMLEEHLKRFKAEYKEKNFDSSFLRRYFTRVSSVRFTSPKKKDWFKIVSIFKQGAEVLLESEKAEKSIREDTRGEEILPVGTGFSGEDGEKKIVAGERIIRKVRYLLPGNEIIEEEIENKVRKKEPGDKIMKKRGEKPKFFSYEVPLPELLDYLTPIQKVMRVFE